MLSSLRGTEKLLHKHIHYTKISEVNLSAFIHRQFYEYFSSWINCWEKTRKYITNLHDNTKHDSKHIHTSPAGNVFNQH